MPVNTAAQPLGFSCEERAEAVRAFDERFAEMERVTWFLSQQCRAPLVAGATSPVVEALVWTLRSWTGPQGVTPEAKQVISQALCQWRWPPQLFEASATMAGNAEEFAFEVVARLVKRTMALGLPRREFALCSKVLHWLLPWRVPVYDDFVRASLGVPAALDHQEAYRHVVRELVAAAREVAAEDCDWLGQIEPRSPLRGLGKCLWWAGGGSTSPRSSIGGSRGGSLE
ncbi:MAG TPA: hypothetical protein VL984_15000 [Acidimicrobiales bacterium]|nr:hypothetical protein [Acidimicrobiales bacterium]